MSESGIGMDKQAMMSFFNQLAYAFNGRATNYVSFSDGSCEFFVPVNETNTLLFVELIQGYFGNELNVKNVLEEICRGQSECFALVFSDSSVNLATFFTIEGNSETYRVCIKLLPESVAETFAETVYDEDDDFEYIPADFKSVTWH